ncbi:cytochrome P450 [Myxococcota bacterium]|nr:cytochrome P450 [Myxococcota bacterium]
MSVQFDPLETGTGIPYAGLSKLRAESPVSRTPNGIWFLARHDDVMQATQHVDCFQASFRDPGVVVPDEEQLISEIPEPRHGRVRKIVNSAIASHRLGPVAKFVDDLSNHLLDEITQRKQVELMNEFVMPIPNSVIAYLLGVPTRDFALWARWSDEVVEGDYARKNRTERGKGLGGGHPEFAGYVDAEIATRQDSDSPSDDFLTRLVQTEVDGHRLTNVELRTLVIFLLIAGNETTRNLIGNLLTRLAGAPEIFEMLQSDPNLIPLAIEESLRLDPPVAYLLRDCIQDIEIGGKTIRRGEKVAFGLASANRDESIFEQPDAFRLDRPNPRGHATFGGGPHVCPGSTLARLETRQAMEAFLARVHSFAIDPEHIADRVPVFWANGPATLPVTLNAS